MEDKQITFDDATIQALFGVEDAESETIERLKEYYLKKDTYERIVTALPIRILVGHKGTGKSALFKVAMSEEAGRGNLPILIKPNDIAELGSDESNFILRIRQWKDGLTKIIGEKVLLQFDLYDESRLNKLSSKGIKLLTFIHESIFSIKDRVDLTATQKVLIKNFLEKKKIVIYIDDVDRGWEGKKDDITRVSALLNAIRDMSNDNDGLLFKISLRSDVYFLVRTSDESTDKIDGSIVWCEWTNHELLVVLVKRILTYFNISADYANLLNTEQFHLSQHLDRVFERKFCGKGKWNDTFTYKVLMSMIRKNPRDLVKLCSLAAHNAKQNNTRKIGTDNLQSIFEPYSQLRVQDTINEFRTELPNIDRLILGMKPSKKQKNGGRGYVYTTPELMNKIRSIMQGTNFVFKSRVFANEKNLAQFLYKINFITARKTLNNGEIQRKYFEDNRYLSSEFIDFGYDWEVHPAYRWALQPDDIFNVFDRLSIHSDN